LTSRVVKGKLAVNFHLVDDPATCQWSFLDQFCRGHGDSVVHERHGSGHFTLWIRPNEKNDFTFWLIFGHIRI